MKSLKLALWITAIGCLVAVPFIVLPWSIVENIILLFGIEPLPNNPVVMYLFRIVCGIVGLIGIYFIILARNPLGYGPMLKLGAYGLIIFGSLSLILGVSLVMPPKVYIGDALSGLVLGIVIIILSFRVQRVSGL